MTNTMGRTVYLPTMKTIHFSPNVGKYIYIYIIDGSYGVSNWVISPQYTPPGNIFDISYLGERKMIFKHAFLEGYVRYPPDLYKYIGETTNPLKLTVSIPRTRRFFKAANSLEV